MAVYLELSDQDSNLNRQNQNLQCYRYTIGQRFYEVAKLYKKPSLQIFYFGTYGFLLNRFQLAPGGHNALFSGQ
jgi:hypothetical protein